MNEREADNKTLSERESEARDFLVLHGIYVDPCTDIYQAYCAYLQFVERLDTNDILMKEKCRSLRINIAEQLVSRMTLIANYKCQKIRMFHEMREEMLHEMTNARRSTCAQTYAQFMKAISARLNEDPKRPCDCGDCIS